MEMSALFLFWFSFPGSSCVVVLQFCSPDAILGEGPLTEVTGFAHLLGNYDRWQGEKETSIVSPASRFSHAPTRFRHDWVTRAVRGGERTKSSPDKGQTDMIRLFAFEGQFSNAAGIAHEQ